MKKLVLASAVISTLVVTGCSSNKPESNYSTAKPIVSTGTSTNKPNTTVSKPNTSVNTPTVVAHKNAIDLNDIKEEWKDKWHSEILSFKMQVKNADNQAKKINLAPLGQGFSTNDWSLTVVDRDDLYTDTLEYKGKLYLFQQDYSALGMMVTTHETENGNSVDMRLIDTKPLFVGDGQPTTNLPTKGTYIV